MICTDLGSFGLRNIENGINNRVGSSVSAVEVPTVGDSNPSSSDAEDDEHGDVTGIETVIGTESEAEKVPPVEVSNMTGDVSRRKDSLIMTSAFKSSSVIDSLHFLITGNQLNR